MQNRILKQVYPDIKSFEIYALCEVCKKLITMHFIKVLHIDFIIIFASKSAYLLILLFQKPFEVLLYVGTMLGPGGTDTFFFSILEILFILS